MARKKKQEKVSRPKGASRAQVVLTIVATDNTFSPIAIHPDPIRYPQPWAGRCIHCNSKFIVHRSGETEATVEHIQPLCDGGDPTDPRNLALACRRCNNEKGIRHDQHAGKGGRADEVIAALREKRLARWRDP
jgi:5-methylcytosine-specific restriction endonuclease McrA